MNSTVLITGATGFVGSRLAERLALGTECKVKAMVRRFSGAGLARLARLPVKLVLADLLDLDALTEAAKDCDVVVHCAYGSSGSAEEQKEVTTVGTENILKAALQADVRKVIYLSSAAIHGRNPKGPVVDESAPFGDDRDVYTVSKIEAEEIVWRYYREHGLPVVVFRPTLIYGPYGSTWTVRIVKEIQSGAVLVNEGRGIANLIYVDNLIDAILLAMDEGSGDGEAFILVDDERPTWHDVYQRYAEMMDVCRPLQSMSAEEIEARRKASQPSAFHQWVVLPWQIAGKVAKHAFGPIEIRNEIKRVPWIKSVIRLVPQQIKDLVKAENSGRAAVLAGATGKDHVQLPGRDTVKLYSSQARFSNEKAKRILGYNQRITFDEGTELIRSWLWYQRLIP